jgi:hypothetical protein
MTGVLQQCLTGRGQLGAAIAADEQLHLEFLFQRPNLAGEHRLSDV